MLIQQQEVQFLVSGFYREFKNGKKRMSSFPILNVVATVIPRAARLIWLVKAAVILLIFRQI
jgi:hypothetical protein